MRVEDQMVSSTAQHTGMILVPSTTDSRVSVQYLSPLPLHSQELNSLVLQLRRRYICHNANLITGQSPQNTPQSNEASNLANYHFLPCLPHNYRLHCPLHRTPSSEQAVHHRYQSLAFRHRSTERRYQSRPFHYERGHPHLCSLGR